LVRREVNVAIDDTAGETLTPNTWILCSGVM